MNEKRCRIEAADTKEKYEGLRRLWCEVFGDEPGFVDAVYRIFGNDIEGYVALTEDGEVVSALSCYRCGTFAGRPVYISYAVCTRESCRGQGIAAALTAFVRDRVTGSGGISAVSPAEESLQAFYAKLGYEPFFFASSRAVLAPELEFCDEDRDDEAYIFDTGSGIYELDFGGGESGTPEPAFSMERIEPDVYNRYREAFLSTRPHVELSEEMLSLAASDSMDGEGLFSINGGDAVCSVSSIDQASVVLNELIVNPLLEEISGEIDAEIASMIAGYFGSVETVYSTPGAGACQTMAAGTEEVVLSADACGPSQEIMPEEQLFSDDESADYRYYYREAYFGFPVQ